MRIMSVCVLPMPHFGLVFLNHFNFITTTAPDAHLLKLYFCGLVMVNLNIHVGVQENVQDGVHTHLQLSLNW